jgi:hypothetical protein
MGTGREPRFIGACYLFVPEARLVIAPPPHSLYPFGLVTLSKKHLHWPLSRSDRIGDPPSILLE